MKNNDIFKNWGTFFKGMDVKSLQLSFANHLEYSLSKDKYNATPRDLYLALALSCRDRLIERWIRTQQMYYQKNVKRVYYLSAEYLMGRVLEQNLINLGILDETRKAMTDLKLDLDEILEWEPDMGLGNGGLGRLAACFLDSLATLEIPAYGYGIRYEFGIFEQEIRTCCQVEKPDNWLKYMNPWEIDRPEYSVPVKFYGRVEETTLPGGRLAVKWVDTENVMGIAYDTPICGFRNNTVNTMRLWSARASQDFDLEYFQNGDYMKAVEQKNISENISKVIYPNDKVYQGKELRLKQQYFFVSCSIQDIIRRYLIKNDNFDAFPDKVAIQMNDTHPSLVIPELMRIFMDEHDLEWEEAWDLTTRTCAFTNHTLLSEALEKWPLKMFGHLLPRPLSIIYEINRRFLRDVSVRHVGDEELLQRVSLVEEWPEKKIRMAHLAIVGSHSVNGVAELHTRLLKERELKDFYKIWPDRFTNKTNGISPRRWLLTANPDLAELISRHIGPEWVMNMDGLKKLEPLAKDSAFLEKWRAVKWANKTRLAEITESLTGTTIDPASLYDVQVKRIHEYKRPLLNLLNIIYTWLRLKNEPGFDMHPRTFIFGGKAAPGYFMAKLIIRFICHVADVLNRDSSTNDMIKIVFLPNYRVTLAEKILPAATLSEQISTAGYEASGTSNMKFALNGALTIGTLDGANIEMMEDVGRENIFIFGLTADEIAALKPSYNPRDALADPVLAQVIELVAKGFFNPDTPDLFQPIVQHLLDRDKYFVMADFASYHQTQCEIDALFRDKDAWSRKAILNVARMSRFSSDRTIKEYNRDIWKAAPLPITKDDASRSIPD